MHSRLVQKQSMVEIKMRRIVSTSFIYRVVLALLFSIVTTVWIIIPMTSIKATSNDYAIEYDNTNVGCYNQEFENSIPELSEEDTRELKGKGIFFHETSCFSDLTESFLTARQACAVESAALTHPNHTVFLLYAAPIRWHTHSVLYKELLKYHNVKVRSVSIKSYMLNTPLEEWYKTDPLQKTKYSIEHTSDVLRYVTLWKYGGLYIDLDFVVLKNMDNLGSNYAGAESKFTINNALMKLDPDGRGHEVAEAFVSDLKRNFNGYLWSHNGPGVITRELGKLCDTNNTHEMNRTRCKGFNIYETNHFYPVDFGIWKWFMQEKHLEKIMGMIKDAYAMHMWNKVSYKMKIAKGTRAAYTVVAEKKCPKVFNAWEGDF